MLFRSSALVAGAQVAPLLEEGRGVIGEAGQPAVGRSDTLLAIAPQLQRDREPIDLRLQFRQALLEPGSFLKHLSRDDSRPARAGPRIRG